MNRKEVKAKVAELMSSGVAKTEVFARLTGQGVKDRVLAYWIASYADPRRCHDNRGHIRAVLIISCLQLIFAVVVGFSAGSEISAVAGLVTAGVAAAFSLLFVWGFFKNNAAAYNAYLILTLTQLPRQVGAIFEGSVSAIGLLIGVVLFCYMWYVRGKIFPDFSFVAPRKVSGEYVFSD